MNELELDSYVSRNFIVCFCGADGKLLNELCTKARTVNYYTVHSVYNTGPGVVMLFPRECYVLVSYNKVDDGDQHILSVILRDKKNGEEFTAAASSIPSAKDQHILYNSQGQGIVFL